MLLGAFVGASGCNKGPATGEVSGTITRAGKAPKMDRLQISFQGGPDNQIVTASIAPDGKYNATGVPVGEVKIGFVWVPAEAVKPAKTRLPIPSGKSAPEIEPSKVIYPIPVHLRDPGTSKLTLIVEAGKPNSFNYDMPLQ